MLCVQSSRQGDSIKLLASRMVKTADMEQSKDVFAKQIPRTTPYRSGYSGESLFLYVQYGCSGVIEIAGIG